MSTNSIVMDSVRISVALSKGNYGEVRAIVRNFTDNYKQDILNRLESCYHSIFMRIAM